MLELYRNLFDKVLSTQKRKTKSFLKSHTLTCFLSALGKCPIEVLPCLDRIAEFVDQQAHSKQATTIIREVLGRIPERLIRTRFESDNTESGFASVAMTLLKVTLKTNGHHFDEAKRIVNIVLGTWD